MRSFSLILILCAATASADSFGPERPLAPATSTAQYLPAVAITTNGLLGLWNAGGTVAGRAPWGQQIAASAVLSLDPVPRRDGVVASLGDQGLVSWVENDWIYVLLIGSDGKPIGPQQLIQIVDSRHTMRMAVASNGAKYLVVWQEASRIVANTVDPNTNAIGIELWLVSGTYGRNIEKVAIASDGTGFLLVWESSTDEPWLQPCGIGCSSTNREIRSIILGADGTPRPGTETLLTTNAGMPDVVWTGSDYLVLWTSLPNGGIAGLHVSGSGVVASNTQTFTSTSDWAPSVARDGSGSDVAFARLRPDGQTELLAMRINSDGSTTALSPQPLVLGTSARQFAIASSGSRVALVYGSAGRINVRYLELSTAPARLRAVRH
jgi:hypothetical protein